MEGLYAPHPYGPPTYDELHLNASDPLAIAIAIAPLDHPMFNGEISLPPDNSPGNLGFYDLEFNLDDLDFAEGLLLDPGQDANVESSDHLASDHLPSFSQPPPVHNSSSPESHAIEGFDPGSFGQAGILIPDVNQNLGAPRVYGVGDSISMHADNSDRDSSGPVSSRRSIDPQNRPVSSSFNGKLNPSSPESVSCDHFSSHGSGINSRFDNPRSPDSCHSARDVSSSFINVPTEPQNYSTGETTAECKVKLEDVDCKIAPKRRKGDEDCHSSDSRTSKSRKSSVCLENTAFHAGTGIENDKKKARLMRNRESAQLSRQRKKQYVEELEDKLRSMHSTITDLNTKISYFMAENATLRQQLTGGGVCPPQPPPPGMYPPMSPMGYPWMPCPPPYVVKPQGSLVPLVPIPRLKPQHPAHKSGKKTRKVASATFLGLLFFFLLVGGLLPVINVRYGGGIGETVAGGLSNRFGDSHKGRILMVDTLLNRSRREGGRGFSDSNFVPDDGALDGKHCKQRNKVPKEHVLPPKAGKDGSGSRANSSEPLTASLYVPRNDKLVQIDGNLIIHSVLASERAMASDGGKGLVKKAEETSLAIPINYQSSYHVTGGQRALGSGSDDNFKSSASAGRLQQWFREGLAGPMLSSGMCTEVFQFDVSPKPGSIVPATSMPNVTASSDRRQNSTWVNRSRNRRILHGHPISFDPHALNVSEETKMGPKANNVGLEGNKSSMVVSVLVDPREAGDGEGETVMRSKSHSRIFVVVLVDSVKYVTYSCMLPLMGSGSHLVRA